MIWYNQGENESIHGLDYSDRNNHNAIYWFILDYSYIISCFIFGN